MKKILLAVLLLLAAGASWHVWRVKNPRALTDQVLDNQVILPTSTNDATTISPDKQANKKIDLLKAEALKIISRPILVKIPISDSSRKSALAKLDELIKLIKEKYDYANAWYDLGAYRMVIGDYEGAVDAYKFVAMIKPNDQVSYGNLGDIYGFYIKNYPLAEKSFLKAIQNNPAYISGYVELASLYESNFNDGRQRAEDLLLSGVKSNPDNIYLKIHLAELYERDGKKSEALALFREISSLDPNNKSVEAEIIRLSN